MFITTIVIRIVCQKKMLITILKTLLSWFKLFIFLLNWQFFCKLPRYFSDFFTWLASFSNWQSWTHCSSLIRLIEPRSSRSISLSCKREKDCSVDIYWISEALGGEKMGCQHSIYTYYGSKLLVPVVCFASLLCITCLNLFMGSLVIAAYTVHSISAPDQPVRIPMNHTAQDKLRAFCSNKNTVVVSMMIILFSFKSDQTLQEEKGQWRKSRSTSG